MISYVRKVNQIIFPVGRIAEKVVRRSVFLTIWHCIFSAKLTKKRTPSDCFFADFAHWVRTYL